MNRALWMLGAGLVLVIAVPLVLGGSGLGSQLRQFPLETFALMLGMIVMCWNLNAGRLRLLLAGRGGHLGQRRALGMVMATEFAISATPGGSGGPFTLMGLLARQGVRPAHASAVFAVDQMTDMLFFLSALASIGLYALSHTIDLRLGWMLAVPALLLIIGFGLLAALGKHHRRLIKASGRLLRWLKVRHRSRLRLARALIHFRHALIETLALPRLTLSLIFLLCCAHWLLRYSILYLAVAGLGRDIDWSWTFIVQMLSLAAGQLTLLPGGAGGAELSSTALLGPVIGASTAAAAVVIWRAVTFYFYLIAGAPVFFVMAGRGMLARLLNRRSPSA
jgi:uncharacterized protein (TIRG00374 family)